MTSVMLLCCAPQPVLFKVQMKCFLLLNLKELENLQTESTSSYATADVKNLVVKVTHSVQGPF